MTARSRDVEERERRFFSDYYATVRCNPHGVRARLERERDTLVAAARGGSLGRVLSIGCGDGRFEALLSPHAESILGIDLTPEAVDAARAHAREAGATNAEFRCLPLSELDWGGTFDTVVCLAFLHHVPVPELDALLRTIRGHLSDGGLLYTQDPNRGGLLRSVGRLLMGDGYGRYHSPDERELDPGETVASIRAAGFETVDVGYGDVTLIPLHYMFPDAPAAFMQLCRWVDRVWCATPLARWASGFHVAARVGPGAR